MYAIVQTGGKQYKVEQGQALYVEKLDAAVGETVELRSWRMARAKRSSFSNISRRRTIAKRRATVSRIRRSRLNLWANNQWMREV